MNQSNLREVEKKTYMSYHQDGLIDIFVGIYVALVGLGILLLTTTDFSLWFIIPAIFPALMSPIWVSTKKKITMPRIGYVKFGNKTSNKLTLVFLGLLVAGLGAFMVLSFGSSQEWALSIRELIIPNTMLIIGVAAVVFSSFLAYIMGLNRLYGYGLFSFVLFVGGFFIGVPMAYFIMVIGFVMVVNGSFLLTRFIRKYPLK